MTINSVNICENQNSYAQSFQIMFGLSVTDSVNIMFYTRGFVV